MKAFPVKDFRLKDFLGECRVLFSYPKNIVILIVSLTNIEPDFLTDK